MAPRTLLTLFRAQAIESRDVIGFRVERRLGLRHHGGGRASLRDLRRSGRAARQPRATSPSAGEARSTRCTGW